MGRWVWIACVTLLWLWTWSAVALTDEEVAKFQALVADARRAQEAGQHEQALALLEEALRIQSDPRVRYFHAVSLQALNRAEEALEEFRTIRDDVLVAKYASDIAARIQELERLTAKVPLTIRTSPPIPATVLIGGRPRGTTPLTIPLRRGEYTVVVSARGYRPVSDTVVLTGPDPVTREYALVRIVAGSLALDCNESGADVFVDGVWQATTPLRAPIQVEVGHRVVRVEKLGFPTQTIEVEIAENQTTSVGVHLEAVKAAAPEEPRRTVGGSRALAYGGFATAGALAATGIGFLIKYGVDAKRVSGGGERAMGGEFSASTVRTGAGSMTPTNAIVGGTCLGVGAAIGVATWLWLWPEE